VAGADFTLADIVLGLSLHRWRQTPIERPPLAQLEAYHQRLRAREGHRRFAVDGQP
jgi:glutathione S-transferase